MKEKNAFIFFNCDEEKSQKSMNVFYNKEIFRDLKVSRKALFAKIEEELASPRQCIHRCQRAVYGPHR